MTRYSPTPPPRHGGLQMTKPTIVPATDDEPISIAKPGDFNLDRFMVTRGATLAGVGTLLTALPHHKLSYAKDWVRLHSNEETHWSKKAFCFVTVPIQGETRGMPHLIVEELALQYLPSNRIQYFRLALAAVANGGFFLCHVPAGNLNNPWNDTGLKACIQAKTLWTQATSRRKEGIDGYKIDFSRDPDA